MKKWLVRIGLGVFALLAIAIISFVIYAQFDNGPSAVLTENVDLSAIDRDEEGLIFQPESPNGKGIILYQGTKVKKEAYVPTEVAKEVVGLKIMTEERAKP